MRGLAARAGAAAVAAGMAVAVYGAYGDPHPEASQESAVPFLVAAVAVVSVLVIGLVVVAGSIAWTVLGNTVLAHP